MPLEPPAPDAENAEDIRLMLEAKNGRQEAFAALVRRHQRALMNFFCRTGVSMEAEDLVQQSFLRLYRYRNRYQPSAKFTTFLYLIARQVRTDALRKRKRGVELAEKVADAAPSDEPPSPAQADVTARTEEALGRLPEGMRDVVVLGILQSLGYEEVGRILRIPTGTVKSRMFSALRRLRADIGESNA